VIKKTIPNSAQTKQIEEAETLIKGFKKEEKTVSCSEKLDTKKNSTNNKINFEQQFQEFTLSKNQEFAKMGPTNEVNLDKKLKEEKEYKTDSVSKMKTQGHYIGLDIIGMHGRFSENSSMIVEEKRINLYRAASSDNGAGVGLNYKYAFNINNVFIAPGIFAEGLGMEIIGSESVEPLFAPYAAVSIKSRHGAFVDLGYDVNYYLSPYLMAGYSWAHYRTKNYVANTYYSLVPESAVEKSMLGSVVYGAGLKLNYKKGISFNIEINTQKFNAKTNTNVPLNEYQYVATFPVRLNTLKVGVLYKF
jgi:hypothetical protein